MLILIHCWKRLWILAALLAIHGIARDYLFLSTKPTWKLLIVIDPLGLIEQAVVEVGTTSMRSLSHYDFRVALAFVIKICDDKRWYWCGYGKYGGSKLAFKTIELCGGADNKIPFSEVSTQFLAMNFVQECTVWVFLKFQGEHAHILVTWPKCTPFPNMDFFTFLKFWAW